jgi:hypothetical protein
MCKHIDDEEIPRTQQNTIPYSIRILDAINAPSGMSPAIHTNECIDFALVAQAVLSAVELWIFSSTLLSSVSIVQHSAMGTGGAFVWYTERFLLDRSLPESVIGSACPR